MGAFLQKKVGPSHSLKPPPGCPLRWLDSYPVVLGSTGINWAHWDGKLGRGKRLAAGPVTSRHQPPVSRRASQPLGCCRQPGMKNLLRKLVPNTPCPGAGQRRSDFKLEHQITQWTQSKKKKIKQLGSPISPSARPAPRCLRDRFLHSVHAPRASQRRARCTRGRDGATSFQ